MKLRRKLGGRGFEELEDRLLLTGPRQMEYLDRGVVATRVSSTSAFISWRSLALDSASMAFNVYRSTSGGAAVKLNSSPLTGGTNYTDSTTSTILSQPNSYFVKPVLSGIEQAASPSYVLPANSASGPLIEIPLRNIGDYSIRHISVGDLNGDGKYDYIVDRTPPSVNEVATQSQIIEAYLNDGTFLWSLDCGPNSYDQDNIEPGSTAIDVGNWDGVTVYDMDGDGKAEVLLRVANNFVFGDGQVFSYPANNDIQFMAVVDGMTGAKRAQVQLPTDFLIDGPLAASLGIGYLDGIHPSLIAKMKNRIGSGDFNQMFVAYDYNGIAITQRWKYIFAPVDSDNGHNIRIVDVDGDGKDEIADTAQVINSDGTLRYNLRNSTPSLGHGDRFQIGDLDPDRPGLETYAVQQNNPALITEAYWDASTGEILHTHYTTALTDDGRGQAGDIDPNHRGYEYWSFYGIYNSDTTVAGQPPVETKIADEPNRPWPNFRVWWDGDVGSENLNNTTIDKWNPTTQGNDRLSTLYHYGSPTSASGEAPIFYGDILGDWREEVVFERSDHLALELYTTQYASTTRIYTLAEDPEYRNCMTVKGYYQSNMVDYYLGYGMSTPPAPNIQPLASPSTAPTVISPAAASANPVIGTSVNLSVLGADDAGEAALTYSWAATDIYGNAASGVNFSVNGTNGSKNTTATFAKSGAYIFTVTITDALGKTGKSNILVNVNQTLTSISVTPGAATIGSNSNQQFFATAKDQFGLALASQPGFTWSLLSGNGSVDASGVYTPTGSAGSAVVKASNGAVFTTASVSFSGTTLAPPTNLAATAVSASQINLTWTDSVSGEDGFVVEWSTDGLNFVALATVAANANKFNVTGLTNNSTYYFRVRSHNSSGAGLPTSAVSALTQLSPIEWLKLDESTGTNAADATGNGHYATTRSGPTWTTGRFGNALSFDGVNDYVELQNNLQSNAGGSVSLWAKTSANFSTWAMLFFMSADTYGNGFGSQPELHINFSSSEKIQLYIHGSLSGMFDHDVNITSASSYANNTWHHIAATWTAGGNAVLYVDGTAVGTQAFAPVTTFTNSQRTFLGTTSLYGNYYSGAIDDVRTFDTALSAAQVQMLATGNQAPTIATAPNATPNPVNGAVTSTLSALGSDDAGESALSYTWSLLGIPPAPVTFSANSTNAAKSTIASFTQPGTYNFQVTMTDAAGLSTAGGVTVTVAPGPMTINGTAGNDSYRVRANGANDEIYVSEVLTQTFSRALVTTLTFNLGDGNDTLVIDHSNGDPSPSGGITASGGNGADTLEARGANSADVFALNTASSITHGSSVSNFSGIETLNLVTGNFTVNAYLGAVALAASSNASVTLSQNQDFAALAISTGAAVLLPGSGKLLTTSTVTLDATARLDLAGNKMIVHAASDAMAGSLTTSLTGWLALGYGSNPRWTGPGIMSSLAAADSQHITAVGILRNKFGSGTRLANFAGQPVGPNDILLRYTYYGDANFDGRINAADYALTDNGFNFGLAGFENGDTNYDGVINGADYALLDNSFNFQGGPLGDGGGLQPLTLALPASADNALALAAVGPNAAASTHSNDLALLAVVATLQNMAADSAAQSQLAEWNSAREKSKRLP